MEAVRTESDVARAARLLGGEKAIHAKVRNAMDAHEVLLKGLPADALLHLVSAVSFLERGDALKKAVGLSLRTLQRHEARSARPVLSVEQGDRAWRFSPTTCPTRTGCPLPRRAGISRASAAICSGRMAAS